MSDSAIRAIGLGVGVAVGRALHSYWTGSPDVAPDTSLPVASAKDTNFRDEHFAEIVQQAPSPHAERSGWTSEPNWYITDSGAIYSPPTDPSVPVSYGLLGGPRVPGTIILPWDAKPTDPFAYGEGVASGPIRRIPRTHVAEPSAAAEVGPVAGHPVSGGVRRPLSSSTSSEITSSPCFAALSKADKGKLLTFAASLDGDGVRALIELLEAGGRDSKGASILKTDSLGVRIIDCLCGAAETEFSDATMQANRVLFFGSLCRILGRPASVVQGNRGICGITSNTWEFASDDPAEICRLACELAKSGQARFRDGSILVFEAESAPPAAGKGAEYAQQILDAAFSEFVNGPRWEYDYSRNMHSKNGKDKYEGGTLLDSETLHEAFYNRSYSAWLNLVYSNTRLLRMAEAHVPGKVQAGLHWLDGNEDGHQVTLLKSEGGRVYFRNPARREGILPNRYIETLRVENAAEGIQSMSREEFESRITSVCVPDNGYAARFWRWAGL